jgi:hypothetical protein
MSNKNLKSVFSPYHKRHVKLGRRQPAAPPKLHFHNYLTRAGLPQPPATEDWSPAATASLSDIYENDTLGDCVIAGGWHLLGVWSGNAGQIIVGTNAQITADYSAIGGYVPGDPSTDQGCDEQTALNYWMAHGFNGVPNSELAGWVGVDATKKALLQQAIYLFENAYFGIELPDAYINPMPQAPGFVWDVAGPPVPENGHCIVGVGYNQHGVIIDTWGMLGTLTWAAAAKYMVRPAGGEAYTLVSQEQLAKAQAKAPNGLDWAALMADFQAMGGRVPATAP